MPFRLGHCIRRGTPRAVPPSTTTTAYSQTMAPTHRREHRSL